MMTNRITHLIDLNNWLKSLVTLIVLTNQSKFNKSTQKVEPANQRPCQLNFVYLCNLQSSPSLIGNQPNTNQNLVGSLNHAVSQLLYTFITNYLYQTIKNYLFKTTIFYFLKLHILKNLSQTYCVLMSENNQC